MELPTFRDDPRGTGECRCDGGQPKNFVRPCLLLLLAEAPAHGYELMERLRPLGFEVNDPATVYRSLRQMEDEGLVTSQWDTSNRGPARRIYTLTLDGHDLLDAWANALGENRRILDLFIRRHAGLMATPTPPAPTPSPMGRREGGPRRRPTWPTGPAPLRRETATPLPQLRGDKS